MRKTKWEKRVEIAKDVLKQIKANKYIAEQGTWVCGVDYYNHINDVLWHAKEDGIKTIDAKKDYTDKLTKCYVCALGSLFVSAIDKYNHTKLNTENTQFLTETKEPKINPLLKWFTAKQLFLIENAFENGCGGWQDRETNVFSNKGLDLWYEYGVFAVERFYYKYPDPTKRLVAIMKNIIRNKGTFVLPGVKL